MKSRCAVATLVLMITHAAVALPPVRGGMRDARDAHVWFEEQPRGAGVEAPGLRLQPTAPVSARYNDNIFASDARDTGDVIFAITPSLVARPQLGRHEFVANGAHNTFGHPEATGWRPSSSRTTTTLAGCER